MSKNKLLAKLSEYLSLNFEKEKNRNKIKDLKKLLKKLKTKEKKLKARFEAEPTGSTRKSMKREIAVLHKQRNKGLVALKGLHKENK